MDENRTKNVKRNSIWGVFCRIIQIICPFIVRTVLINILGDEYTGLNGLFTSILKVLSLAELGFSSAITYNMYKPIAENDISLVCALLKLYKKIYTIVGLIVMTLGLLILPFIKVFINGSYPNGINIYILYVIYLLNTCLTYFLFAYRTSLLNAYQRYDRISAISIVSSSILYVLEIESLILTRNYYIYAVCVVFSTVINNILIYYESRRLFPEIVCRGDVSEKIKKDIKRRVTALLGHRIGTAVITSADNIVISSFLGLVAVTYFNNYYYIISALIGIIDVVLGGAVASVGNYIATKSKNENYSLFKIMNFILTWIVGWASICYVCLIQDFIEMWLGDRYKYDSIITIVLFGIYFYSWKIRSVNVRYKEAAGMWNDDFWKPYVAAIVNVVINIILVNIIGIDGVLISTIIAMIFINLPWETFVLCRNLFEVSTKEFYIELIYRTLCVCITGLVTYKICAFIHMELLLGFLIKIIICIFIPNILLLVVLRKDKEYINSMKYVRRIIYSAKN